MHIYVLSLHASPRLCQGSLLKSEQVGEAALTITKSQGRNRILLSLSLNPSQLPRGTCTHSAILRFLVAERPENQGWIHTHQQMRSRCSGAESPPQQLTQHPGLLLLPLPLKNHQLSPFLLLKQGKQVLTKSDVLSLLLLIPFQGSQALGGLWCQEQDELPIGSLAIFNEDYLNAMDAFSQLPTQNMYTPSKLAWDYQQPSKSMAELMCRLLVTRHRRSVKSNCRMWEPEMTGLYAIYSPQLALCTSYLLNVLLFHLKTNFFGKNSKNIYWRNYIHCAKSKSNLSLPSLKPVIDS